MTETNHSQSIPVSSNVFLTKNKKMTKRKDYVIDTSKIKTLKDVKNIFECLGIICDMSILEESGPRYELAKEYFVIPYVEEPRKSLEEIQKELDKKFEKIIEQYKRNSYAHKLTAERKYEDKFDRISYNFQCAVNNGVFPHKRLFGIADCSNVSVNNAITHKYVIKPKPNAIGVGYYQISSDIQFWMKEKPNFIVRNCAKILLGLIWKDTP
jgi:hypothetical protein